LNQLTLQTFLAILLDNLIIDMNSFKMLLIHSREVNSCFFQLPFSRYLLQKEERMKKFLVLSLLALIASLAVTPPISAGERAGAISVSPYIGGYTYDGDQQLETRPVYGLRLGYDITDNIGVEGVFNYVDTASTQGYGNRNAISYRLDLLYNFQPKEKLVPYLAIGGGGTNIDKTTFVKSTFSGTANLGGGLKYFLTDSIALRADVRQLFIFNGNKGGEFIYLPIQGADNRPVPYYTEKDSGGLMFNWEYSVGLSFLFGPPEKPAPPVCPPPEPAPEPKPVPPPPPPAPQPEKVCMTLKIEFDFDKYDVKPKYHDVIGKVAEFLKKYPETTAVIEGHTDNRGSYKYNIKLSERRADSVRNYLVEKFGINAERLTPKGYGYTKPIASNKTAEGRQKNRRVDAIIDCIINADKTQ
jgi:OOP family OmpA-OmpF porin